MKTKAANSKRLDILGNGAHSSDQEIFTNTLKQWRQRLGYCSIFAAVPAMLASYVPEVRSDQTKKPAAAVAGQGARLNKKLNVISSTPALLKRQSKFVLPHQKGNFAMVATIAGNDDCPGSPILGGNYTAAAPYTISGDTTGANDTVAGFPSYYYYSTYNAHGPDHVYSFTLTAIGPNPQIEVTTTSGTYRPMVYVLRGGDAGSCPAGTGSIVSNWLSFYDTRFTDSSTATFNSDQINFFPLNVPLYLFVDSAFNDVMGAGPYTIRMQDVTIAPATVCDKSNPIDCADFFIRQQYLDFLNREPEPQGFNDWMSVLNGCNGDLNCLYGPESKRTLVSKGFFGSQEFNLKGAYVFHFYKASLGRMPTYAEMVAGLNSVTGATADEVNQKRAAFASDWVVRSDFLNAFPRSLTATQFVDDISQNAGIVLSNRSQVISDLSANNTDAGRATALHAIVDSQEEFSKEFNAAFVYMQYVGYLRRDPEPVGYNDWLMYLNTHPDDFNTMVWGFVDSAEYRHRFGP